MPQLDLVTYSGIISFFSLFFFVFLGLSYYFLPVVLAKFLSLEKINGMYTSFQNVAYNFSVFVLLESAKFVVSIYNFVRANVLDCYTVLSVDEIETIALFRGVLFCEYVCYCDLLQNFPTFNERKI